MSVLTTHSASPIAVVASSVDLGSATAWQAGSFAGGIISIPTGSTLTSLTFYHSDTEDGTYLPLHDSSGTATTLTCAADKSYVQPQDCNSAVHLKVIGNAAGTINWSGKTL